MTLSNMKKRGRTRLVEVEIDSVRCERDTRNGMDVSEYQVTALGSSTLCAAGGSERMMEVLPRS